MVQCCDILSPVSCVLHSTAQFINQFTEANIAGTGAVGERQPVYKYPGRQSAQLSSAQLSSALL